MKKIIVLLFLSLLASTAAYAQTNAATDVVMIMPFENRSDKSEFNWVGESVAESLTELLNVPGLQVVTNEERKIIQQRMNVPLSSLPSLASSLKIARQSNATLLVAGRYNIVPATEEVAAKVTVNAKLIRVKEGSFLSETFPDGSKKTREIDLFDALGNLQTVQGQLAYQILYQRDKALPFSQNQFIEAANKVPSRAFEAYIKGLLTDASDTQTREAYFKNALRIYASERDEAVYGDAALELGHVYERTGESALAIEYFALIPEENNRHSEGAFYSGLIFWKQENYEQALAVLAPLAEELELTSVFNTAGAVAVEASLDTRDAKKAAKFMADGVTYLKRSAESTTEDTAPMFNYGLALMHQGLYQEAADALRPALANNPRDGESHFLLAKALEKLGNESAKDFDDQARRFLTENNRYAALESDWKKNSLKSLKMRVNEPSRDEFLSVVLIKKRARPTVNNGETETEILLRNAKELYKIGKDDESMEVLRRILVQEPMSAESYLLLGKIHFRRGDIEQSTSSLKTALFWNSKILEAHVLLGRIFVDKGDCLQATNYSKSALAIDPDNESAVSLERQVERCSK